MNRIPAELFVVLAVLAGTVACRSAYYSALEKFGVHKRDILVDRVEEGREAQQEAKEEIVDALAAFKAVAGFKGGELEAQYSRLKEKYDASAQAVEEVKQRIDSIEEVSKALFEEWEGEIDDMQDEDLKRDSKQMLAETSSRYATLIKAMQTAESKMEPVLVTLKDHVTFLKHNLNARAVTSLQKNLVTIERDVAALLVDMEKSIAQADAFIAAMSEPAT